ncbi:MAG: carbon storage regulator [Planctomycetaceae bacterium]
MLILTRKAMQVITLGDDIKITVLRTAGGSVKLGIEAPTHVRVSRPESFEASEVSLQESTAS